MYTCSAPACFCGSVCDERVAMLRQQPGDVVRDPLHNSLLLAHSCMSASLQHSRLDHLRGSRPSHWSHSLFLRAETSARPPSKSLAPSSYFLQCLIESGDPKSLFVARKNCSRALTHTVSQHTGYALQDRKAGQTCRSIDT
eukprot:gnl/TRDRNA2_/TRDRNA2_173670_c2_seq1.p1 gnl/TRDRNA2_/TRDRNA2_173670_c2~~gnl/TRDRNA2_/TRDRNA2_173670_c2_seq1.p1  ORF type:complete len:141 (+),score=11.50 gnl/TRDRNA2_/TRDRNA2_173670_c2_seq1:72-494(+)